MQHSAVNLEGFTVTGTDGIVGFADSLYCDNELWVIRYIVVQPFAELPSQGILISPLLVGEVNHRERTLTISASRQLVQDSPAVNLDEPVSRRTEIELLRYYDHAAYWDGAGLWGGFTDPKILAGISEVEDFPDEGDSVSHLMSTREILNRSFDPRKVGDGMVTDLIYDETSWKITNLVIETRLETGRRARVVTPNPATESS
jgi:hypothetical protein